MSLSSEQRATDKYTLRTIGGIFGIEDHNRFRQPQVVKDFEQWFPVTIGKQTRVFYETGVDALAGILQPWRRAQHRVRLWVAVNFCQDSLVRLQTKLDHQVDLLKYNSPDDLPRVQEGDVVLYLHFNRYDPASAATIALIRERGALAIEDFVQAPLDIARFTGDFAFNSLRKYSSLDLAVAYGHSLAKASSQVSAYWNIRKQAEIARSQFLEHPGHDREQRFLKLARDSEAALEVSEIYAAQPDEIERARSFDFAETLRQRRNNYQRLATHFRAVDQNLEILPGEYMYLMIATAQRDQLRSDLFARRIFPVIHWADSDSERSREILSFHIDQRYNATDMDRVADAFADCRRAISNAA